MLRLLHTSDWHLGQSLRDLNREAEQQAFLQWLGDLLESRHRAGCPFHALLHAGDIFDGPNPSARAQELYYGFLERARHFTKIILIAGNHDSAERLDAPGALLHKLGVHIVGAWPESTDLTPLLCAVQGEGEQGLVLAMPFLRNSDLGRYSHEEPNWFAQAHRRRWEALWQAGQASPYAGATAIGMGHCFAAGATINEDTERRVGHQDELSLDIFPSGLAYLALGHLHKAQRVGGRESIRYCGSCIPLGFSEVDYAHQVLEVVLERGKFLSATPILIPRSRDFLLVPRHHASWQEVESAILALPDLSPDTSNDSLRPWAEVRIRLPSGGLPELRTRTQELFATKQAMLFRINALAAESGVPAWEQESRSLDDLNCLEVFHRLCEEKQIPEEERPALLADFQELLREQGLA